MGTELRDKAEEVAILQKVEAISDLPDEHDLALLVQELFSYLALVEECPDVLLSCILQIIRIRPFHSSEEFGALLRELSISSFFFSVLQKKKIVEAIMSIYQEIDLDLNRISALAVVTAFSSISNAADQMVRMFDVATASARPVAELVWELNPMSKDKRLSISMKKEIIRRVGLK